MPLHSEEAAVPWGSNFFLKALKAGIGAEVMKLEEVCFQALGDLSERKERRAFTAVTGGV